MPGFNLNLLLWLTGLFGMLLFRSAREGKALFLPIPFRTCGLRPGKNEELPKKKLDFVGCFYKIESLSSKGGDPLLERFRFKGSSIC